MSSIDGVIHHETGIDVSYLEYIKDNNLSIKDYTLRYPSSIFAENPKRIWEINCDIALPCATENELDIEDAKKLVSNGIMLLAEGANMPTTLDATHYFMDNNILFMPGKGIVMLVVGYPSVDLRCSKMHYTLTGILIRSIKNYKPS